jgi:predicted N-acetyltransferase YhbS
MAPQPPAAFGAVPGDRVRELSPADSFDDLTGLLHRAYAALSAKGWNYTAVDQDVETTRRRATRGRCLVAERGGRVVGTISMHRGDAFEEAPLYRDGSVVILEQLAVEPDLQGLGIGEALMAEAERRAREEGAREAIGDTAEGADHLIAWYRRLGYGVVATERWPGKSYRSVVLSKALGGPR